jgi:alkyl hydroperoxide reductase subunit AhpF
MALISSSDQDRLRADFAGMTRRVRLLLFTQAIGCETCPLARQIVDELPPLSDRIAVEEVNSILEAERARQFGIDQVPAIAVLGEDESGAVHDAGIRFLGAPAGYEFLSLVRAVLLVGGQAPVLSAASRARLAAVDGPVSIQVFTTPG